MDQTKKPALLALCRIFAEERVPYAIIGGLALQVHQREPRTTLDIDIAVLSRDAIPRDALRAAGFRHRAVFEHSENWVSVDGTAVQFSDDPAVGQAVLDAGEIPLEGMILRVIRIQDLLREKLRAASDPARRRSKRMQDLADVQSLLEQDPELAAQLTAGQRAMLDGLMP